MFVEQFLLFSFLSSMALLVFVLAYVYYLFTKETELRRKQEQLLSETESVIDRAKSRAHGIIERAVEKSQDTLLGTDYLRHDLIERMEGSLRDLAKTIAGNLKRDQKEFDDEYKELFDSVKREYIARVDQTLSTIESIAQKEFEDFRKIIREETVESQSIIGKRVNSEFDLAKKEIEEYKKEQMAKIDSSIEAVLQKVAREVFGKTLSLSDHEDLIREALEQAKKEGFLEKGMAAGK